MAEWNAKANDVFLRAAEVESPADRQLFLDRHCGDDAALRAQVESLLAASAKVGSFLNRPAAQALAGSRGTADYEPIAERPGAVIGPYKLMEQIGEGGMGLVFVAEQQHPVRRKVALKIIKPGMDSKQVIARFEAERQALAMMDHQNIAKVYDAGTTESGRPYFVMELVHGVPITEYCDANQLTPRQRLELFVPVCQAVQHAHQKGIIHRDLKPSNVLVTLYDDKPVPKVIDFGVAKAIEQRLTEKTVYTQFGMLVGTFEYMSPEQAEMNAFGVDTRSDVYSLGVLLYELLTGTTPIERPRLREAAYGEIVRLIKEEEPPRPSVRLSSSSTLPKIAAERKTEPAKLAGLLRGELDWIVMKCLEKDRSRRYETANGLARDVERYLKDEAVEACPPSVGYRLRKFARKHNRVFATAAAFVLLLAGAAAVSTALAVRATLAEGEAQRNEEQANEARWATERERDRVAAAHEKLKEVTEDLRRALYVADVKLAENAWRRGETRNVVDLLQRHRPKPNETDLRHFEWHYLWRLCHGARLTLPHSALWVGFSPDGRRIASVDNGNTVKVWDAQSGKEVFTFRWPTKAYPQHASGAFSPDGKLLALTGLASKAMRGQVKVLDAATGKEVVTFQGHQESVYGIAFSPDSKHIASAGGDAKVRVWDATSAKEVLALDGFRWGHSCVAFSPDGKQIAAGTYPGDVKVWDVKSGKEMLNPPQVGNVTHLAYSPDGKLLAAADPYGQVGVMQATTGTKVHSIRAATGSIYGIAFSKDGKWLATASGFGEDSAKIWDTATGEEVRRLRGHDGGVRSVAFSPDGRRLAAASGVVQVWDVSSDQEAVTVQGNTAWPIWRLAFHPDGKLLASTGWGPAPKLWDTNTWKAAVRYGHGRGAVGLLQLLDPNTWKAAPALQGPKGQAYAGADSADVIHTVFSADGRRLAGALRRRDAKSNEDVVRVKVWDIKTGHELCALDGQKHWVSSMAFSPDGRRIASVSMKREDATVKVWEVPSGREVLSRSLPARDLHALAFSPDAQRLASAVWTYYKQEKQGRYEVKVWDLSTGKEAFTLRGHTSDIYRLAFTPDGRRLASASADGTVRIWDTDAGREVVTLRCHTSSHDPRLALSPDGRRLATASGIPNLPDQPGEVRLWDLLTGREVLTLVGHKARVSSLTFSPDGRRLVSADYKGVIKVWDASPYPSNRPAEGKRTD
jgi:WD40 repeat protein/serine/threonine protein kinase